MTVRGAIFGAALLVALTGCAANPDRPATDTTTSAAAASASYYDTEAGRQEMIAGARGVITGQVSKSGHAVTGFGAAKFPTALEVVMPADVVTKDGSRNKMWFRVAFISAGGSLTPFGAAKVGTSEAEVS
ncbi:hypothetical protein [Nocardia gipuzkoensis]